MDRPNLNKMCETFIRIGLENVVTHEQIFDMIRSKVCRTIDKLKKDGIIDWYSFLIHDWKSGVPTTSDDNNLYFHIRVSLLGDNTLENLEKSLPECCLMTRQKKPEDVDHINIDDRGTKFDTSLLKHEDIEEVWRIFGEQSEFFLNVFNKYKENAMIPINEILSLLHYFHNMVGLSIVCPHCKTVLI